MKLGFVKKLIVFSILFFIVINLVCFILLKTNLHVGFIENGQIYHAIKKSSLQQDSVQTFILGGSVANQMYYNEDYNGKISSFCTVMPITMAGQYLLLKNLIKNNKLDGKTVVLIMHPNGFTARLHGASLYHYFMKPFYNSDFIPLMDSFLLNKTSELKTSFIYQLPMIRCSNWVPTEKDFDLENTSAQLAPMSIHYLKEIEKLSIKYQFKFKVIAPIQPLKNKELNYSELKKEIQENDLGYIFRDYFEDIKYLADKCFVDGFHVKDRHIIPYNILNL